MEIWIFALFVLWPYLDSITFHTNFNRIPSGFTRIPKTNFLCQADENRITCMLTYRVAQKWHNFLYALTSSNKNRFLPRCMECRRCLTMRILSVCLSVRLYVCLSNACIVTKRKKYMFRFLYYTKDHLALFSEKRNGQWAAIPSTLNFGSTGPLWSKIADFQPIIARSASAIIPSEKSSIKTNRKSLTRFPMILRWSSYVAPKSPKGGSKTQNGRFPSKIALRLKKVCYKVYSCENCQRQGCMAFIGLINHAKMIGGEHPLVPEI